MRQIERSHRSVEFKYQNISAVLDELGLPWIPGYKPKENYQNALFSAIDRYLSRTPRVFELAPVPPEQPKTISSVFVTPPEHLPPRRDQPEALHSLVRKFDPAERDIRNRSLGRAGEAFVIEVERKRLEEANRRDLARRIRWVAAEDGDGAGYDILSFTTSGSESLIEVKTTHGAARTPFFLTRNECEMARERPVDWRIYRVHLFAREPRIFMIAPPLESSVQLIPTTWRATFAV
jgi:hypothetical protein